MFANRKQKAYEIFPSIVVCKTCVDVVYRCVGSNHRWSFGDVDQCVGLLPRLACMCTQCATGLVEVNSHDASRNCFHFDFGCVSSGVEGTTHATNHFAVDNDSGCDVFWPGTGGRHTVD